MLDHHHTRALLDEALERAHHVLGVLRVEPCARLVHHEERPLRGLPQRARELEALRLAAGERRERLPKGQIPETNPRERLQRVLDHVVAQLRCLRRRERREHLVDRHREHLGDGEAGVLHREHVGVEALALADRAEQHHIREELHLHGLVALARARLATTLAGDVEREVRRRQAAAQRLRLGGEARAHAVPGMRVGCSIPARRPAEGRLIDEHGALEALVPLHRGEDAGLRYGRPAGASHRAIDDVLGERALA